MSSNQAASCNHESRVEVTDDLPADDILANIEAKGIEVYDHEGKPHSLKNLYEGPDSKPRVMLFFTRHFFCPPCQQYLRVLFKDLNPETLPEDTSFIIVGCGQAQYIDHYANVTGSPFPIYTDPTRRLHDELGMARAWSGGTSNLRLAQNTLMSMYQIFTRAKSFKEVREASDPASTSWGDPRQQAGEFLVEPTSSGKKAITWCHRMAHSADHTPHAELLKVSGVSN